MEEEVSRTRREMLFILVRSGFLSRVMLRCVSIRVKSNMVYEILYELFGAFLIWMQTIRFVKVMSGPKTVKVTDKSMPGCCAKGFQSFMYTV